MFGRDPAPYAFALVALLAVGMWVWFVGWFIARATGRI